MKSFFGKKNIAGDTADKAECCMDCAHFRNSPEYLEAVIPGLKTMSSGHASVRKDDGICTLLGLYLSANAHCDQFAADDGTGKFV